MSRLRRWYCLKWVGLAACLALLEVEVVQPNTITRKGTEVRIHNSTACSSELSLNGVED